MTARVSVLFVCLGNICRSPTAHGIFQKLVDDADLGDQIHVDSAGTGDWHIGHEPDKRAQEYALKRGYDLSALRARQVIREDFDHFDYILGMDMQNMSGLEALSSPDYSGHLSLFLDFLEQGEKNEKTMNEGTVDEVAIYKGAREVPDPYYGGEDGFELVLDMVEKASNNLLAHIRENKL